MIAETNYCAEAVDALQKLAGASICPPDISGLCAKLSSGINQAVKFRLPDNGDLLGWHSMTPPRSVGDLIKTYAQPFRLPYDAVALEYQCPMDQNNEKNFDASVVLAVQTGDGISIGYASRTLHDRGGKFWVPGDFACTIYPNGTWGFGGTIPASQSILDNLPEDAQNSRISEEMGWEIMAIVQLIAALACRNVTQRVCSPNAALQKKRAKNGRFPLYSYRILEIDEGRAASGERHGSHASPRVHLRRGHIRRLPDRNVWVNACVVGNKAMGMVAKDYAFKPDTGPKIAERMH